MSRDDLTSLEGVKKQLTNLTEDSEVDHGLTCLLEQATDEERERGQHHHERTQRKHQHHRPVLTCMHAA